MIPRPPLDHGLPALSMALDAGAMAAAVRLHVPAVREGELELVNCRPVYIRYKRTSCLVQYELRLRPTDGSEAAARPQGPGTCPFRPPGADRRHLGAAVLRAAHRARGAP